MEIEGGKPVLPLFRHKFVIFMVVNYYSPLAPVFNFIRNNLLGDYHGKLTELSHLEKEAILWNRVDLLTPY